MSNSSATSARRTKRLPPRAGFGREPLALDVHDGDVVLAAGVVRRLHQRARHLVRLAGVLSNDPLDFIRGDQVREPVTAEEQCRVRLHRRVAHVDEIRVANFVRLGPDVAVDLVAAGMPHRVELGDFSGVLTLADRRVVRRQLLNLPAAQFVEPRVADVADHARGRRRSSPP